MSGHGIHVHGAHDHAVEHEAHKGGLGQQVAIFSAILANVDLRWAGAMLYKNDAVLERAEASDSWNFYQAKSMKQNMAEIAAANASSPAVAEKFRAEAERYKKEKAEVEKRGHDAKYKEWNAKSDHAMHPHHFLSISMTFLQIAIALASITVLTQKRWLFAGAAVAALVGAVLSGFAYL